MFEPIPAYPVPATVELTSPVALGRASRVAYIARAAGHPHVVVCPAPRPVANAGPGGAWTVLAVGPAAPWDGSWDDFHEVADRADAVAADIDRLEASMIRVYVDVAWTSVEGSLAAFDLGLSLVELHAELRHLEAFSPEYAPELARAGFAERTAARYASPRLAAVS